MAADVASAYLQDVRDQFRRMKTLAEGALAQVSDDDLLVSLDPEANSLAVITRHMAGNLRSRFTDFLTTDGEKPTRNRDAEFELPDRPDRAAVLADWESGWAVLFATLDALTPADLLKDVLVRGERLSVIQALDRQLIHHAQHVGQLVFLAKHLRSSDWKSLSIPRRR
ncbi:MAG TPA: DUF1572 family protein [Vicinamibacterales bacterium]|nr:DUF1572 family protein [Vicinamibacterales bacterium]